MRRVLVVFLMGTCFPALAILLFLSLHASSPAFEVYPNERCEKFGQNVLGCERRGDPDDCPKDANGEYLPGHFFCSNADMYEVSSCVPMFMIFCYDDDIYNNCGFKKDCATDKPIIQMVDGVPFTVPCLWESPVCENPVPPS